MVGFGEHRLELVERHVADVLARADQIDSCVHGGAVEEAGDADHRLGLGIALEHTQEDGLEDIFGVAGAAGDAVRGAEHHGVVVAEDAFQVRGGGRGWFH